MPLLGGSGDIEADDVEEGVKLARCRNRAALLLNDRSGRPKPVTLLHSAENAGRRGCLWCERGRDAVEALPIMAEFSLPLLSFPMVTVVVVVVVVEVAGMVRLKKRFRCGCCDIMVSDCLCGCLVNCMFLSACFGWDVSFC